MAVQNRELTTPSNRESNKTYLRHRTEPPRPLFSQSGIGRLAILILKPPYVRAYSTAGTARELPIQEKTAAETIKTHN